MKKIGVILFSIFLIGVLAGTASAKPRWINTLTLMYPTGVFFEFNDVEGGLAPGFKLYYDETVDYYYLWVKELDPLPDEGMYPFYLKTAPKGPYFEYWASRGVTADATADTWQAYMWKIINGEEPMFYLWVGWSFFGPPTLYARLIDGLQYYMSGGTVLYALRINGDYFVGTYHFIGYPALDGQPVRTMIKLFFANT